MDLAGFYLRQLYLVPDISRWIACRRYEKKKRNEDVGRRGMGWNRKGADRNEHPAFHPSPLSPLNPRNRLFLASCSFHLRPVPRPRFFLLYHVAGIPYVSSCPSVIFHVGISTQDRGACWRLVLLLFQIETKLRLRYASIPISPGNRARYSTFSSQPPSRPFSGMNDFPSDFRPEGCLVKPARVVAEKQTLFSIRFWRRATSSRLPPDKGDSFFTSSLPLDAQYSWEHRKRRVRLKSQLVTVRFAFSILRICTFFLG